MLCLVYWQYAMANPADANAYFRGPDRWLGPELRPGAIFIAKTVDLLKSVAGGSMLDFFLLFQSFGMIGIALLMRCFFEIAEDLRQPLPFYLVALLFLPGIHFWSSALGKDAPLFMSCALCVWAMIRIERRYPAFLLALAVMGAIRPHVAGISMLALVLTLTLDSRVSFRFKVPFSMVAAVGAVAVANMMQAAFDISAFDPDDVTDFLASKQEYGASSALAAGVGDLPYPLRILTLLFRPLFFDASGMMGIIVSVENAVILGMSAWIIYDARTVWKLFTKVTLFRFCTLFSLILILLLSWINYNVGLGLRQKMMAMPAILVLFVTLRLFKQATHNSSPHQGEFLQQIQPTTAR